MQSAKVGEVGGVPVFMYKGATAEEAAGQLPGAILLDEREAELVRKNGVKLGQNSPVVKVKRVLPTAKLVRVVCQTRSS